MEPSAATSTASTTASGGWTTGTIRRLFVGKGFGFVSREEAKAQNGRGDVFLHFSDLDGGLTSSDLAVGVRVRFRWEAAKDSRGPGGRARLVSLVPSHPVVELSAPRPRPTRTGRVYHKDTILAMRGWMHKRGQVEKRQKWPLRPDGLPRETRIEGQAWGSPERLSFHLRFICPTFTGRKKINVPWRMPMMNSASKCLKHAWTALCWGLCRGGGTGGRPASRSPRPREDYEGGADSNNAETFGENWALETWSYEDAVAANNMIRAAEAEAEAAASYEAASYEAASYEYGGLPSFFGFPFQWTPGPILQRCSFVRVAARESGRCLESNLCWFGAMAFGCKDLQETWSRPDPQNDPQAAEREREKLERLVEALQARQHADESGGDVMSEGSSSPKSSTGQKEDWSTMVIYQEIQAEDIIFRQHDPPDGCWVVLSGSVGVFIFKRNELLDDEPPTPREEYDPSEPLAERLDGSDEPPRSKEFNTLQEERERMKQRGALRSAKTAKDLADLLTGQAEVTNPKAAKSKAGASALESWAKAEDEEPRYKSIEGFSTWSFSSVLGVQVAQLGAGRIFGELALQTNHPRAASIKCLETTAFLRIPYTTYQAVVKDIFEGLRLQQECSKILQGCSRHQGVGFAWMYHARGAEGPGALPAGGPRAELLHHLGRRLAWAKPATDRCSKRNGWTVRSRGEAGTIDVLIWKAEKRSKSGGLAKVRDDQPTPRFQEPLDKRTTMTEALAIWKKTADGKSSLGQLVGFSSFAKDSKYGARVIQLKPGSIVGELALQTNEPRAATIKCATDCKFMVVGDTQGDLLNVPHFRMIIFLRKRTFPENYSFMFEGIIASEPALFLMQQGTIEFRRHTHVAENSAYANRHHPLAAARLPELPLASRQSTSARRNQRLAQLQALQAAGDQRYEERLWTICAYCGWPHVRWLRTGARRPLHEEARQAGPRQEEGDRTLTMAGGRRRWPRAWTSAGNVWRPV
eukprot:g26362.t1